MTSGNSFSTAGITKLAAMLIVGVIVIAAVLAPMLNDLTHETIVEEYNSTDDASWIRMNYGTENIDTECSVAGDTLTVGDQSGAAQDMILYADEKVCVMYSDGFTIVNGYSDPATVVKAETVHITNADGTLTISDGTDTIIQTSSPAWAYYPNKEGIYGYISADVEGVIVKDDNLAMAGNFAGVWAYNDVVVAPDNAGDLGFGLNAVVEDGVINSVTWAEVTNSLTTNAIDPNTTNSGGSGLRSADPSTGTRIGDLYYTFSESNATVVGYASTIDWSTFTTIPETVSYDGSTYNVYKVGNSAFANCRNLALTSLPSSMTVIDAYAFSNCVSLALTSLPSGLTYIGNQAFNECSNLALTSLPSGITYIGSSAFANCRNITCESLPTAVTNIGTSAFQNCTNLKITSLPSGLTDIGNYAFYNCTSITSLIVFGSPSNIRSDSFGNCTNLKQILNLGDLDIVAGSTANGHIGQYADEVRSDIPAMGYVAPLSNTKEVVKEGAAYDILLMMPVLLVIALLIPIADYFVGDNIRSRIR